VLPLHISANSGVPVYLQIEQQIKQAIASGVLHSGDALPSTRRTAAQLRINPNTVARAYTDLEREGLSAPFLAAAPSWPIWPHWPRVC
jgi:GntR family transcriptional regulator